MERISEMVDRLERERHNTITGRCCAQLTAACRAGAKIDAVMLLYTALCYGLKQSKSIVDDVRDNNMTFTEAYKAWILKD